MGSIIAFFLVSIAWMFWQISAYNNAVLMAREAGFYWKCETSVSLIRKDWRNALKKETWGTHARSLQMKNITNLDDYREMLRHLRPNGLFLNGRNELKNVDALEITNNLNKLHLYNCTRLQNVDGLKNHTSLTRLMLYDCTSLQNVDGLKDLAYLKGLDLGGCSELKNVDSLKKLTSLTYISLEACHKIPAADLRELHAALPKTKIVFPDGTNNPPQ